MSEHVADIVWERETESFAYDDYNRTHVWRFDNGLEIAAAAAPGYLGDPSCLDPEEAFVASVSSCHMLTFLAIAARKRLTVDAYEDHAVGHMEKNAEGRLAITRVNLHPKIKFADGVEVDADTLERMHHSAHDQCFIANSVKTEIIVHY
ncbi:OsmC family protein [Hyphococcus luteus]|uniref:Osmotically inducible protein OsmC n=1 Tax=Hyphococcus luteus TaxID=2058213 RepID=A0A2S7K5J9_9PROT|nr:OsmC family protein [Marinicaulis flavus]PQA87780.1 osmotically inducible protein OsmC [Marinicaulis flavus]